MTYYQLKVEQKAVDLLYKFQRILVDQDATKKAVLLHIDIIINSNDFETEFYEDVKKFLSKIYNL